MTDKSLRKTYNDLIPRMGVVISTRTERRENISAPLDDVENCQIYCKTTFDDISAIAVVTKDYHLKYPTAGFVLLNELILKFRDHFCALADPPLYEKVETPCDLPFK